MAENETLDLWDRHSGRWRQLLKKIESDEPAEQIADDAVRCLYKTFQNLVELLPLHELLDAAKLGSDRVREGVRRCRKGRDYAEVLAQQSAIHSDPQHIMEGVARATTERFFDLFAMEIVGEDHWPDAARFRVLREDVSNLMQAEVAQLARVVAEKPNEKPRMPTRSSEQKENDHRDLLKLSLQPRSGTHG
jgi:hypothetical protein